MTLYINTKTLEIYTEHEIRVNNPNISFTTPFYFDGYEKINDAPQPDYDIYSQLVRLLPPTITENNVWVRKWEVYNLSGEELTVAQKRKIDDEKAKIKISIAKLEASVTPRRQREAILGIDTTWLADIELQIAQLRAKL